MHLFSDYHLGWFIPILLVSGGLAYFFYKNQDWLQGSQSWLKKCLVVLRFTSLFFILSLLLGIILEAIDYKEEKPILITLVDTSSSMKNYGDSLQIQPKTNQLQEALRQKFGGKFELINYTVGEKFEKSNSPTFNASVSDLQSGFDALATRYYNRNIGGIIFVSDGNFNKGSNPIYAARQIPLAPIFTIGVGDTLLKKDQLIKEVNTNDFTFLRSKFPVEVTLEAIKFSGKNSKLTLFHEGKSIASKSLTYSSKSIDNPIVTFEVEAVKTGFQHYTLQLSNLENEYTLQNNSYSFYIEVLDNRSKVLLLSGSPHPDVTALKSIIEKDENIQVQIANSTQWKEEYANVDLVIWHEPGVEYSSETNEKLKALKKPVFYFIGPNTSNSVVNQLNLGFSSPQTKQTDEVQASVASQVNVFEMPSTIEKELGFFPPVFVKYGGLNFSSPVDVLLYQKLGTIIKKDPLLFFGQRNQTNYGVFYGEGIWKWKFYEYSKTKSNVIIEQLFQKVFSYLLVKQNTSALHVTLPRKFTTKEEVKIKAEFYNPSMELITTPSIQFELIDSRKKKSVFQFGVSSNYYSLPLGTLNAGKYTWQASTVYAGKRIVKSGSFVVENLLIEQLDTRANHLLLRSIASNSNASFYKLSETDRLLQQIEQREDIAPVSFEHKTNHNLLDYVWILVLILSLLSAEWFLKKWHGGY
jgi:hypothetical protein